MRTVALIFISVFTCLYTNAQWQWSNPQPSGYGNTEIIYVDALTGYALSANGDILKTIDKGASWHIERNIPGTLAMAYKDSTFIIGGYYGKVYISTDIGQTWIDRSFISDQPFEHFEVISRDTIIAVSSISGSLSRLYKSVDRGLNWQLIMKDSLSVKSIDFVNSKIGFLSSHWGIYKTTDGGNNWRQVYADSSSAKVITVKFRDENFGLAYQEIKGILKTVNGGATWTVANPQAGNEIFAITYTPSGTIYTGGEQGVMLKSQDQGVTWQPMFGFFRDIILSISFIDENNGFITGYRGQIVKTTNAGNNWIPYSPTYIDIMDIDFPTPAIGYAATWTNLFKTIDNGQHWTQLPLTLTGSQERFRYLHFYNKDTGIVIYEDPVKIYKTYNGGNQWQLFSHGQLYLDDVLGFSSVGNTTYISTEGAYGCRIIKSIDVGETWTLQTVDYSVPHRDIFFTSESTGYSQAGPNIYKTTDSAKTWRRVFQEGNAFFETLWFTNSLTGYAGGDQNYLFKTTDSGHTWNRIQLLNLEGINSFNDIRFFNERIGYFLSDDGKIVKTIDSGRTWHLNGPAPLGLTRIKITSDSTVYVAGLNGRILKSGLYEYALDSLKADSLTGCGGRFSVRATAFLSKVDSIWFEYGTTSFTNSVTASPFSIKDTTVRVYARTGNLSPSATNKVRVKIFYKGLYYYSDPVPFAPVGLPAPHIVFSNGVLVSSSPSGNQWYFNNNIIAGANQSTYSPTQAGMYTVVATVNGCQTDVSTPFQYIPTAINDPVLLSSLKIFPNPVNRDLYIINPKLKKLSIELYNVQGIRVRNHSTSTRDNYFNMRGLPAGLYILRIGDVQSRKEIRRSIIKL